MSYNRMILLILYTNPCFIARCSNHDLTHNSCDYGIFGFRFERTWVVLNLSPTFKGSFQLWFSDHGTASAQVMAGS